MVIHYICRGNAFRSLLAEAYTKSLHIPNLQVISSGSAATSHREMNIPTYAKTLETLESHGLGQYAKDHYADDLTQELLNGSDVAVFMNRLVIEEAQTQGFHLPKQLYIWDVTDMGEPGRMVNTPADIDYYYEQVLTEISHNVDTLLSDLKLK